MSRTGFFRQVGWLLLAASCASGSTDSSSPSSDLGSGGAKTGSGGQGGGGASSAGGHGGNAAGGGGAGGGTASGGSSSTSGGGGTSTTSTGGSGGTTSANPCSGVACDTPPPDVCKDVSSLLVHDLTGTCANGECTYAASPVTCANGCASGACQGNPCSGVVCSTPPPNECGADNQTLRVYTTSGTCNNGVCQYTSQIIPCSNGCSDNACVGDPCAGVTCITPPANECASTEYLTSYSESGTCSNGQCSYSSTPVYCSFGCASGVCNGDPCIGKSCNAPPANTCKDASTLTVHEAPGTCADGACTYEQHDESCAFGCQSGSCKNDPCAGKTCTTPTANYCVDGSTLRKFTTPGTCSGGTCAYDSTDVSCPGGCANGACKECSVDANCASGQWCNNSSCVACNSDNHCGASCTNCVSSNKVCSAGACVECTQDAHCGSGKHCSGGTCLACSTSQKCGPSCVTCSGATPVCDGSACVCDASSCGAGAQCAGGACATCGSDAACGATCSPCGGATPRCFGQGASSQCVQCLSNDDCVPGDTCEQATHTCRAPSVCTLPADACSNGSQDRFGCSNARVIGRAGAAAGAGFVTTSANCESLNFGKFNESGSCYSAAGDHAYRIFARAGESIAATVQTGTPCYSEAWDWHPTLMIWKGSECGPNACTTRLACKAASGTSATQSHAVTEDGWYTIVVDGRYNWQANEPDEGTYTLTVKLTTTNSECP